MRDDAMVRPGPVRRDHGWNEARGLMLCLAERARGAAERRPRRGLEAPKLFEVADELLLAAIYDGWRPLHLAQHLCGEGKR